MKIEPCPYCGEECIPTGGGYLKCLNIRCPYHVPAEQLEQHNRLSRIVRAAGRFIAARNAYVINIGESPIHEIETIDGAKEVCLAESELADAVEGGRADG